MDSTRALVMSVEGHHATVMVSGGHFRRIPTRGQAMSPGQEIWLPTRASHRAYWALPAMALALLLVLGGPLRAPRLPVADAVVSLDINPSINFTVGGDQRVIGAMGMDSAGQKLLLKQSVVGESIAEALQTVTREAWASGYMKKSPDIVLGGAFPSRIPSWFRQLATSEKAFEPHHLDVPVVTLGARSQGLVRAMVHSKISVGRYLLWQSMDQGKKHVTVDEATRWPLGDLVASSHDARHHQPTRHRVHTAQHLAQTVLPGLFSRPSQLPASVRAIRVTPITSHHGHTNEGAHKVTPAGTSPSVRVSHAGIHRGHDKKKSSDQGTHHKHHGVSVPAVMHIVYGILGN